ncbi:hypothetical protein LLG96_18190 [bacterium]|nr:hypothetical protein [bacterium]
MSFALRTVIVILFFVISAVQPGEADETIKKFLTEITYTKDNNVLRFRPFYYILPAETQQTDVMLGRKFGSFTVYGYWKYDNKDRSWIGARADYTRNILRDTVALSVQVRYFEGLNNSSKDHCFFLPQGAYKIGRFGIGALGYGKQYTGKGPEFYVCPLLSARVTGHIDMSVFYGIDVFSDTQQDMLMWKTNFSL